MLPFFSLKSSCYYKWDLPISLIFIFSNCVFLDEPSPRNRSSRKIIKGVSLNYCGLNISTVSQRKRHQIYFGFSKLSWLKLVMGVQGRLERNTWCRCMCLCCLRPMPMGQLIRDIYALGSISNRLLLSA
jgi:hypothetical protein